MKSLLYLLIILAAIGVVAKAQTAVAYPATFSTQWQSSLGYVPSSPTAVTTSDSYVDQIHFANNSASTVNCLLTDTSTNCGAAACQWWPTVTIAANTVYTASVGGLYVPGGVKWSCSVASAVVGWIKGKYPVH